jgi:hypothetical protein
MAIVFGEYTLTAGVDPTTHVVAARRSRRRRL